MFRGEFEYRVDEKGRVGVPPEFRRYLCDDFTLVRGVEPCIEVRPPSSWQKYEERILREPVTKQRTRQIRRFFYGSAFPSSLDKQGRIMLPPRLREYAGIKDSVIIISQGDYFELWDKEKGEKEIEACTSYADKLMESLEQR